MTDTTYDLQTLTELSSTIAREAYSEDSFLRACAPLTLQGFDEVLAGYKGEDKEEWQELSEDLHRVVKA